MSLFANAYQGRRVLVTGHTGFKGSWLSLWLTHLGAKVSGFSVDIPTQPSNFELLGLQDHITHYMGDIRDRDRLAEVVDEVRPEIIFHMAAQALVRRSYADPATTFEVNMMGMVNVLEVIRTRPWIEAAVLITSDKAYRNNEWYWGYRETDTLGGYDPYSGSKSCADLIAQSYVHSFFKDSPTRIGITRAGNVIGGGDWADDRIVPDCIRAWSKQTSVMVRSPMATRPWQHVLEPLSGYLWLGAGLSQGESHLHGEAFNFGPDASVNQAVGQLLDAMCAKWPGAKWESPVGEHMAGHEATLLKLTCDKALSVLQWKAILSFHDTVDCTVDWYRAWHNGEKRMFEYTLGQIDAYTQKAQEQGLAWSR